MQEDGSDDEFECIECLIVDPLTKGESVALRQVRGSGHGPAQNLDEYRMNRWAKWVFHG